MKMNNDVRLSDETIEKILLLLVESMKRSHIAANDEASKIG